MLFRFQLINSAASPCLAGPCCPALTPTLRLRDAADRKTLQTPTKHFSHVTAHVPDTRALRGESRPSHIHPDEYRHRPPDDAWSIFPSTWTHSSYGTRKQSVQLSLLPTPSTTGHRAHQVDMEGMRPYCIASKMATLSISSSTRRRDPLTGHITYDHACSAR
jgi:hypothetical protein